MFQAKQIEKEYQELLNAKDKPIKENANVLSHLKWQKAVNDLTLAKGLLEMSTDQKIKNSLNYSEKTTFFDWVIVCSYYSIFHATQALLGIKKIKITSRLHRATIISFAKQFIINQELEEELFLIYKDSETKAKELLEIFEEEKDGNKIIVTKDKDEVQKKEIILKNFNFVSEDNLEKPLVVDAKIRYGTNMSEATLHPTDKKGNTKIIFKKPQFAATPGQFCVVYKDNKCLGGGVIS